MFQRTLQLPENNEYSFFLWGPRQTGKSTLLKTQYPHSLRIDLLKTEYFIELTKRPSLLREMVLATSKTNRVIIDEIQKIPLLLDEVHYLIEEHGYTFALCGSSARKVRRGHANLLGGRAAKFEMFGLTAHEVLGKTESSTRSDLLKLINFGNLPNHILQNEGMFLLKSYIEDYLKEEIAAEALVRNLAGFSQFLNLASIADTEFVHYTNIARECGVSSPTVKEYYQILLDTLLGKLVSPFVLRPKRTTTMLEKFYFKNVGVVNFLAKRGTLSAGGELFGKAFENFIFHEISAHLSYYKKFFEICYWRTKGGVEVDFIVGNALAAIEVKGSDFIDSRHLKGLRSFREEYPEVKLLLCIAWVENDRKTEDGIWIVSPESFIQKLWNNEIF
jgi:uncharacterized protein